jgi:hypothetical protein
MQESAGLPRRPMHLSRYAELCLEALSASGLGEKLSLGGAPRDFRDIYALCQASLTDANQCWQWWRERQRLANSDEDATRARLAVETHLARIAAHRPLDGIGDAAAQLEAERVRAWLRTEFLDALVD